MLPPTLKWEGDALRLLDQRALPLETKYRICRDYEEVAAAIEDMTVRGAPAIGVAAAYGLALAEREGEFAQAAKRLGRIRAGREAPRRDAPDRRKSLLGHKAHGGDARGARK